MDKYAAEKIASEYYELGVKHAHQKLASSAQKAFNKTINALAAAGTGLGVTGAYRDQIRAALGKFEPLGNVYAKTQATKDLALAKQQLAELAEYAKRFPGKALGQIKMPTQLGDPSSFITQSSANKLIEKNMNILGAEGMSGLERLVDVAPQLALAGGIGTGVYKGLGKLDRKLKLY